MVKSSLGRKKVSVDQIYRRRGMMKYLSKVDSSLAPSQYLKSKYFKFDGKRKRYPRRYIGKLQFNVKPKKGSEIVRTRFVNLSYQPSHRSSRFPYLGRFARDSDQMIAEWPDFLPQASRWASMISGKLSTCF